MTPSPTIRLFVSSTFSDLKAERDALQREVFPRLKKLCQSKGLRFQAIDLRWGISEEAGRDNRTMRICLRELRRCQQDRPKPNFLILLGDRYGWRPLPEIIPASLFERIREHLTAESAESAKSAKSAEMLNASYRRDDNAVPPIYELQPRGDNANWHEQVEKPLLTALEQAAQTLGLEVEKEGVTIGASATEQEIIEGALKDSDAATHVRAFFRTIEGLPNPAPEDYVETGEAADRLNKLKERISGHIGDGNVCRYRVPCREDGKFTDDDLKELCEQARKQLSAVVEKQIAALAKVPPDEQEELAHEDFGKERCRHFVGRREPLERIANYLREGSGKPLAVIGPSGSGKSAVMAKAVERCQRTEVGGQKSEIIARFIGATPASSDLIQLLRNLVGGIRRRYPAPVAAEGGARHSVRADSSREDAPPTAGAESHAQPTDAEQPPNDSDIPFEYNPLVNSFHEALKQPTADRPLFLFLDALDQLTANHNAHSLAWLPASLNPHVRLIVSAALPAEAGDAPVRSPAFTRSRPPEGGTPNDPRATIMSALTSRLDAQHRVTLAPLTAADGEQMLTNWLADAHRTLQPAQRQVILETFKAEGRPLWLRTAAEEAARLASWQPAPTFAPTTPGLLGQVLDRLSREEEHGDKLVSRTLSYLACARHGLAEDEILDILSADEEVMADFRRRSPNSPKVDSLPVAVWVRLHGDLAFYLAEHQAQGASLLGFYHRSFLEAVTAHCFASREAREARHQHLSVYFLACAKGLDPAKEWETDAVRGFAECVFHLVKAGQPERAAALLSNFPFLLHKLRVGLLEGVFEDYEHFRREAPAEQARTVEIWGTFFREKAHILRRGDSEWPTHKILLQLATEHADDSPLTIAAECWLAEDQCDWFWLRRVPRPNHAARNPCVAVFEGHTEFIVGATVLSDFRLLSWSGDNTLRLWDGASGKCLAVLEGHTDTVDGALALPDGRLLSWSFNTLMLWDGRTNAALAKLKGHAQSIAGAMSLPGGRLASWSHSDMGVNLWDGNSGTLVTILKGHTDRLRGALALSNGRLLSWSWDRTLCLWDGSSGALLVTLKGHSDDIRGATTLPDGRLVSWSREGELFLWDGLRGTLLAAMEGHTGGVGGVLPLPDGRLLSWSADRTLRLWDGTSGTSLVVLKGHQAVVTGAIALPDDRLLSWSNDSKLRIWNGKSGDPLLELTGHTRAISGAVALPGGQLLSWSDSEQVLRLWDATCGSPVAELTGHGGYIRGVTSVFETRVISWSNDQTLRLWDSRNVIAGLRVERHTQKVTSLLRLPHDRLLSQAEDSTLRLWDSKAGAALATLEAHSDRVKGVIALPDGRLLSWSNDGTLRLWDGRSGTPLTVLKGHTNWVNGAMNLPNSQLLSWSHDKTLRLWDSKSGTPAAVLKGHTDWIDGAMYLPDGRLLSWSFDHTARLWDSETGSPLLVLSGHTGWVSGVKPLPNGRLLSWSHDNTLRLWDGDSGTPLAKMEGHTKPVKDAIILPCKRLLSWAYYYRGGFEPEELRLTGDNTLRLWDGLGGSPLATLQGHTDQIEGAMALPNNRILSWSRDHTLRIWDCECGMPLAVLAGHTSWVFRPVVLPNDRLLSWSLDRTFRVWDTQRGTCLEVVDEHAALQKHLDWMHLRCSNTTPAGICGDLFLVKSGLQSHMCDQRCNAVFAAWHADAEPKPACLDPDGTVALGLANGQVYFLKLFHGHTRISLAEAEAILGLEWKKAERNQKPRSASSP